MNWVRFETVGDGIVMLQPAHVEAIYNEQGAVKLATVSGGVHILKGLTVEDAASSVSAASTAAKANRT